MCEYITSVLFHCSLYNVTKIFLECNMLHSEVYIYYLFCLAMFIFGDSVESVSLGIPP